MNVHFLYLMRDRLGMFRWREFYLISYSSLIRWVFTYHRRISTYERWIHFESSMQYQLQVEWLDEKYEVFLMKSQNKTKYPYIAKSDLSRVEIHVGWVELHLYLFHTWDWPRVFSLLRICQLLLFESRMETAVERSEPEKEPEATLKLNFTSHMLLNLAAHSCPKSKKSFILHQERSQTSAIPFWNPWGLQISKSD